MNGQVLLNFLQSQSNLVQAFLIKEGCCAHAAAFVRSYIKLIFTRRVQCDGKQLLKIFEKLETNRYEDLIWIDGCSKTLINKESVKQALNKLLYSSIEPENLKILVIEDFEKLHEASLLFHVLEQLPSNVFLFLLVNNHNLNSVINSYLLSFTIIEDHDFAQHLEVLNISTTLKKLFLQHRLSMIQIKRIIMIEDFDIVYDITNKLLHNFEYLHGYLVISDFFELSYKQIEAILLLVKLINFNNVDFLKELELVFEAARNNLAKNLILLVLINVIDRYLSY